MKLLVFLALVLCGAIAFAGERYNFRESETYGKLPGEDRAKLEQVHRDFMMLWGALDRYADQNGGDPPGQLEDLVPCYLGELPDDPFAEEDTAGDKDGKPQDTSKSGTGYSYRKGAPGNRAWCLSSVGLPEFPYLAARGNVGLYVCKGSWISGVNPAREVGGP